MNDPIGQAIADYFVAGSAPDIQVKTSYTDGETLSPTVFFRNEAEMPVLEATAIALCRGKVLDVGAAAGRHALILQQKGLDVVALEQSTLAAEVMLKRGVKNVVCADVLKYNMKGFDTVFILMNGTGIGQTIAGLKKLLLHLRKLLNPGGQILIDSSDISYLFEEEDGSVWIDLANSNHVGEVEYELTYKNHFTRFKWLFVDFDTLSNVAQKVGLKAKKVAEGEHFDYLAQLTMD